MFTFVVALCLFVVDAIVVVVVVVVDAIVVVVAVVVGSVTNSLEIFLGVDPENLERRAKVNCRRSVERTPRPRPRFFGQG